MNTFQQRVGEWMAACFSRKIVFDTVERNHRFLEESLELVQSQGCTRSEANQLVDYVFNRPVGEPRQEVGGVIVTLCALCNASNIEVEIEGARELSRIWQNIEKIRAKQAAKPKHSPLPETKSLSLLWPCVRVPWWIYIILCMAMGSDIAFWMQRIFS